jgi:hypothetical protein
MNKRNLLTISIILVMTLVFAGPLIVSAHPLNATAPVLGTAGSFAVLGGSSVTNTGPSLVTGDLGVWPGTSITGILPGMVIGTIHANDAVALQAQSDVTTAYNALAVQACGFNLTGQDLGGMTLTPGVYCFDTSAQLTGALTLDAQGDPNAVWVFQTATTLITATNSSVAFINGGAGVPGCNVFWQVGSSATLGTNTDFTGNILALASITMNTGANLYGSTLARNGAVTLDTNLITESSGACTPTAVELKSFTAARAKNSILLNWATASETGNLGFNLYRATSLDGARIKLNAVLIPARPGSQYGTLYSYTDTDLEVDIPYYYYWLETVDLHGKIGLTSPQSVRLLAGKK